MNSKRTKKILVSCGVILVVACLCLGAIAISGVGVAALWPFDRGTTEAPPIPTENMPIVPEITTSPEADVEGGLPPDLMAVMQEIEAQVSELRGLSATKAFDRQLISPEELERIVVEDFFAEYTDEEARKDVLVLSLLGLLPPDFDLKQFYTALYSEQIAGFYDSEEGLMYVVQGSGFGGSEKITYAHEFTHVLQDQTYGLEDGLLLNEEACEADSERCAAVTAVIEGDASLTELLWFQSYASSQDYEDLMEVYENYESPILDSAPPYLAANLYFPYEKGQTFVEGFYDQGGFDALDKVYGNPPVSTEQILHPERYPEDSPVSVSLPDLTDLLGGNWTVLDQNVMGEWFTFLILHQAYEAEEQLPEREAARASEGWGGDAYAVYLDESSEELVFVMDTIWDSNRDANEFSDAFQQYADLRWEQDKDGKGAYQTWTGPEGVVAFWQEDSRTVWVMAPSEALLASVIKELQ